ncbi:MAG: RsmB/NOP family class I SAM-dependent RNA methyltransferase, partial [Nannocystaceae bacterium]
EVAPIDGFPGSLRVRGGGDLFYGPLHEAGLISVQGLGSQQAAALLQPKPGERVLDACAGQGGKSAQLAELMERRGELTMVEPNEQRVESQRETIRRCRLDDEALTLTRHHCTLANMPAPPRPFDAILVDAPCTGLGDLARHPELRWMRQPSDLPRNVEIQRSILKTAAAHLAPEGSLVWSVCSLEPEEGSALIEREAPRLGLTIDTAITLTPETHGCDGFFAARLHRGP